MSREVTTTKSVMLEAIAEVSGVPACDLRSNFSSSHFPEKLSKRYGNTNLGKVKHGVQSEDGFPLKSLTGPAVESEQR